jgi:hypothetical protein
MEWVVNPEPFLRRGMGEVSRSSRLPVALERARCPPSCRRRYAPQPKGKAGADGVRKRRKCVDGIMIWLREKGARAAASRPSP